MRGQAEGEEGEDLHTPLGPSRVEREIFYTSRRRRDLLRPGLGASPMLHSRGEQNRRRHPRYSFLRKRKCSRRCMP